MAQYRVAKRYAKGLIDFLGDSKNEEKVVKEMTQLRSLIEENRDLQNFFKSPVLDYKRKTEIMKVIFKDYSKESLTFLSLIIKQGRSEAIGAIATDFLRQYREKKGIKTAEVISASPLDKKQTESIVEKAKALLPEGTKIEVKNKVDPSIIGGFVLRLDDQQFDASIKTKLNNIKKSFDH